ncbi:uncharacterized protein STAUR_2730 [Stigmatella aurantiaca DW4/3-1]|uniref:Uncharacterized protein n=1 Tax=Stigmatella aurantiaca (strain DW4/3-1) TaxID=378806 RepID=E3FL10_STIAD|nr:uncharacterized protein STAUR_2730 [Stigmatella aurantiaca DW4/3-1]
MCMCLLGLGGCSSTLAAHEGTGGAGFLELNAQSDGAVAQSGSAIAQGPECTQKDTTVSCCLKKHPGEYERCGAPTPKQTPKKSPPPADEPNRLPPLTGSSPEGTREREQRCREYYYRCLDLGGEYERRGMFGKTICQSCWTRCNAEGSWPKEVNDFPCLGG